jgi:2-dehydropantoate 2-reductase
MGSVFAAFLKRSKPKDTAVWLLDKDEKRSQKLNRSGITVEYGGGSFTADVQVTAAAKDIGSADIVFLCVKSYDTKSAVEHAKPLITADTAVVTLQNGVGNIEAIAELVGENNVVGGSTNIGATLIEPGRVKLAGKGETVIGKPDGKLSFHMRSVRELFNKAGLETRLSQDIKSILWSKLMINCGINALAAILRLQSGRLLEHESSRSLMREAVTEAVKIAKRKRIKLLYDDPLAKVESVCESTGQNVCSMLQDVLKGKRTEIDVINGVIVRFGQELGIAVPVNAALVNMIRTIETSYDQTVR